MFGCITAAPQRLVKEDFMHDVEAPNHGGDRPDTFRPQIPHAGI